VNYAKIGVKKHSVAERMMQQDIDNTMHNAAPFNAPSHIYAQHYTTDSSDLNSMLHAHHNDDFDKFENLANSGNGLLQHVRGLDKELDHAKTTQDMSVYTGIRRSPFPHFENGAKHAYLHMPAYTSTSPSFHIAASFARSFPAYGEHTPKAAQEQHGLNIPEDHAVHHVLKLNMPAGSKAASVRGFSVHGDESEILLHRGYDIKMHPKPTVVTSGKHTHLIWNADLLDHDPTHLPRSLSESIQTGLGSIKALRCGIASGDADKRLVEAIEGFPIDHEQHKNAAQGFTMPAKAQDALKQYSVTSLRMNSGLWSAHMNTKNLAPHHYIADTKPIADLDDAFKRAKSKAPVIAYTGVRDSIFGKFNSDNPTVTHHPAFLSTSTAPNIALSFAYHDTDHQKHMLYKEDQDALITRHQLPANVFDKRIRHVLRLEIPAGTKAISLANGVSKNTHEHEILLHRGHDLEIDPIPHSIHPESFAGSMDKAHVIVWNARVVGHSPMKINKPLVEGIEMTLVEFLENNRNILTDVLLEEVHPDIIKASEYSYGKNRLAHVARTIRNLLKSGVDTGLHDDKPKKGSSRAVFFPTENQKVKIDGQETEIPHVLKVAFHGKLDPHTKDGEGLLGESQNEHEIGISHHYSMLTPDREDNEYTTNENGFMPPLLKHGENNEWVSVGKVSKIGSGDFRKFTKTKEFPKGISHSEFYDAVNHHYVQANGGSHYSQHDKEHLDKLYEHPLVERAINFTMDTDTTPGDFVKANMGIWEHPITKEKHIVTSDAGLSKHVLRRYKKARQNIFHRY
jgi:hypothetical protein